MYPRIIPTCPFLCPGVFSSQRCSLSNRASELQAGAPRSNRLPSGARVGSSAPQGCRLTTHKNQKLNQVLPSGFLVLLLDSKATQFA